ncbi:MAG TPA: site-2 protease family protein, partial [Anaeromyxobacteraceae bacterium]
MGALHATFRPAARPVGPALLAGAAAGGLLGALLDLPALLFALLGAAAAFVAVAARHAAGLRAVATAGGLHVAGPRDHPAVGLEARWEELRLGFGFAVRADGGAQRYAIVADGRGRSFAFASLGGGLPCAQPVTGADGRPVPVVDLGAEAAVLLGVAVQRAPAWQALPEQLRAPPPSPGEAAAAAESAAAAAPPPP